MRKRWKTGKENCGKKSWDELQVLLAAQVGLIRQVPDRYLIVTCRDVHRFVQFASCEGGDVIGEAVGNHFLCDAEKLSSAQCRELRKLGWGIPHTSGRGQGNFWLSWPASATASEIATIVVRSLRDAFGLTSPSVLELVRGEFIRQQPARAEAKPSAHISLRRGQHIVNKENGRAYRIDNRIGQGGFGVVYRAEQTRGEPLDNSDLCVKVCGDVMSWHCEAYFGRLLQGESRVVRVYDSFAWAPATKSARPRYCLVIEYAEHGDLGNYLKNHKPFSDHKARTEMISFLRTLKQLHAAGVVHRDLTPKNVLVASSGSIKIADFGIAAQGLMNSGVRFDTFNPAFAPPIFTKWLAADDVFQCGQVYAFLLAGRADAPFKSQDVRKLDCSPEAKAVIQRCIGARKKRYQSATEMLRALELIGAKPPRQKTIHSLDGKNVVFTGKMGVTRKQAKVALKKAGGIVQTMVGHQTDVVVKGRLSSPLWKAGEMGQKLLDVEREREDGHVVVVLSEERFWRLCGKTGWLMETNALGCDDVLLGQPYLKPRRR